MSRAFLGLGSNLGDSFGMLQSTVRVLGSIALIRVVQVAPVYVSEPMGGIAAGQFLNTVVEIETELSPQELLRKAKGVETDLGRQKRERWDSREIDIDLLLFDNLILHLPELSLPHPGILSRDFVLIPLCDLAPELIHPETMKKISEISVPESGKFVTGTYPEKLSLQ